MSLPEFRVGPPRIFIPTELTKLLKQGFTICMKISDGKVIETYIRKVVPIDAPHREIEVTEEGIFVCELGEEPLDLMKKGFVLEVCVTPRGETQVIAQKHVA